MVYLYAAIGYVILLVLLVRFFQAVHRWDVEIHEMQIVEGGEPGSVQHTKAA